jgi:hypothetical protein
LIEIFSKSNGETFDVDFDEPEEHFNTGKYPFIYDMGAAGAGFNTTSMIRAERWINSSDRGCIAFIGSTTDVVYTGPSIQYSKYFNQNLFRKKMNKPIGDVIFAADSAFLTSSGFYQMRMIALLGDPSLVMCNPLIAGIDEQAPQASWAIYPNPANNEVKVSSERLHSGQIEVDLISLQGALLRRDSHIYSSGSEELSMNLDGVASGLYLIQVTSNGELIAWAKISVQK